MYSVEEQCKMNDNMCNVKECGSEYSRKAPGTIGIDILSSILGDLLGSIENDNIKLLCNSHYHKLL